jgi:hypothetical protein
MPDEKKPAAKPAAEKLPAPTPAPPPTVSPGAARVCRESDRAVPGLKRFRVRAVGSTGSGGAMRPVGLYVLAPDKESAEACYRDAEAGELKAAGFDDANRPILRTDELPD